MSKDPWVNRLKNMQCQTCQWYVEKVPLDNNRTYTIIGRCRKNAPIVGEGYPAVFPNDWCGAYKIDENSI